MSGLTERGHQIIEDGGRPVFVVVPFVEYVKMTGTEKADAMEVPWEVARLALDREWSLIRAWREHLGLTQAEVAGRMSPPVSRGAYAQMEAPNANPRIGTINRIAAAMGLDPDQLTE